MTPEFTILLGWWHGWRDYYTVQHVRAISRQLRSFIRLPFKIALLTDEQVTATEAEVDEVYPGTEDPDGLKLHKTKVNCYRRLRYFDAAYASQFGTPWVMSIDMDTLIRDDISDIVTYLMHEFGFGINRAKADSNRIYSGAMFMLKVGEHQYVWDRFDPRQSPVDVSRTRLIGSDQTWMSMQIENAPTVGREHGIYYLGEYRMKEHIGNPTPRIINFSGNAKPWSRMCLNQAPDIFYEYIKWLDKKPVYAKR